MSAAPSVFALIPAAGAGSRFGGTVRKAAVEILGRSIASWSIGAIDGVEGLVGGAVIVHESNLESAAHWIEDAGVRTSWHVVTGRGSRAESVARGVAVVPTDVELVLVHDAARPLVHRDDRDRVVEVAADFGAAILAHRQARAAAAACTAPPRQSQQCLARSQQ